MVNFYSGFIVPEGARATQKMFEMSPRAAEEVPGRRGEVPRGATARGRRRTTTRRATSTTSSITSTTSSRSPGIDHVGIGSDFDGIPKLPRQLEDVSCYPLITQELLNRGYTKEQIHKMLGGNLMRVVRRGGEGQRSDARREVRADAGDRGLDAGGGGRRGQRRRRPARTVPRVWNSAASRRRWACSPGCENWSACRCGCCSARGRAGSEYTRDEFEVVVRDAQSFLAAGADGLVFGALDRDGSVDRGAVPAARGAGRAVASPSTARSTSRRPGTRRSNN